MRLVLLAAVLCVSTVSRSCANETSYIRIPDTLRLGTATAAYQIEGGWNVANKQPSIWDTFVHDHPERIADHSTGDVGPNSYELFEQDIAALKELGVSFYRFSISWSRIMSYGHREPKLNVAGAEYYAHLLRRLKESGIAPMVTMYHYDLPQALQDKGGFLNPEIVDDFRGYAKVLFQLFGNEVSDWITFNEPEVFCVAGYGTGVDAPAVNGSHYGGEYLCAHHVLMAHAAAQKVYSEEGFRDIYNGRIGITISSRFCYPAVTNDMVDAQNATERGMAFQVDWFAHPLFSKTGGYSQLLTDIVNENSIQAGMIKSRLPVMNDELRDSIRDSADFLGLNYYTSRRVAIAAKPSGVNPSFDRDQQLETFVDKEWKRAKSSWLFSVPQGLFDLLRWIKSRYGNPEVLVTENGWSDDGQLDDSDRVTFIKEHLAAVVNAIVEDNCNVTAYTVWSLIDNFEWCQGYTEKFGVYAVNMSSPTKERLAKKSAQFVQSLIANKQMPR